MKEEEKELFGVFQIVDSKTGRRTEPVVMGIYKFREWLKAAQEKFKDRDGEEGPTVDDYVLVLAKGYQSDDLDWCTIPLSPVSAWIELETVEWREAENG